MLLVIAVLAFPVLVSSAALLGTFFGPWRARAAVVAGTVTPFVMFILHLVYLDLSDSAKWNRPGMSLFYGFVPFLVLVVLGVALGFVRRPSSLVLRYLLGLAAGFAASLFGKLA